MLDKINMILKNSQGNPIGYKKVSTTGTFGFPSLAYGTYWLHPEMPGVTSDDIMIVLTPEKPHADVVMTFTGHKILGIGTAQGIVNRCSVYPNPVGENLTIAIDLKQAVNARVGMYNITGQPVVDRPVNLDNGDNKINISRC